MDRTEAIFENFDTEAAETKAEVLDQTISLLRSTKECESKCCTDSSCGFGGRLA